MYPKISIRSLLPRVDFQFQQFQDGSVALEMVGRGHRGGGGGGRGPRRTVPSPKRQASGSNHLNLRSVSTAPDFMQPCGARPGQSAHFSRFEPCFVERCSNARVPAGFRRPAAHCTHSVSECPVRRSRQPSGRCTPRQPHQLRTSKGKTERSLQPLRCAPCTGCRECGGPAGRPPAHSGSPARRRPPATPAECVYPLRCRGLYHSRTA